MRQASQTPRGRKQMRQTEEKRLLLREEKTLRGEEMGGGSEGLLRIVLTLRPEVMTACRNKGVSRWSEGMSSDVKMETDWKTGGRLNTV